MSKKFLSGIDVAGQPIANVPTPTAPGHAAPKSYVDNAVAGLAWKQPVRAASTTNVTVSSVTTGSTLDGVTLAAGDRVLLKDQTTGSQNGIYVVAASGAPSRASDADTTAELNSATVYVIAGTVNADRGYSQTANDPTPDTTALVWAQVGGGTAYSAGNGLALAGTTFSVAPKSGGGIVVDSTGVALDPAFAGLAKRYATTLPAGGTSTAITHNLGTTDVTVSVYDISGAVPVEVEADVTLTSANVVTIGTAVAVTASQYRVVIVG